MVDRARIFLGKAGRINLALFDYERSSWPVEIADEAKAWIVNVTCQKLCDLVYVAVLWILATLHKHI